MNSPTLEEARKLINEYGIDEDNYILKNIEQDINGDNSIRLGGYFRECINLVVNVGLQANPLEPLVMLRSIAKQLNQWADESKSGGWSTHQVKPMQEKAAEIYQLLDKVERIEASK
jgi:hypothetical protein